jgi:hypothetical protein
LGTAGEDYVGNLPYKFLGECANAPVVASCKTIFALQITANNPARPREPLPQRGQFGLRLWIVRGQPAQHADPTRPLSLLRARRERPCRHATEPPSR